jgi:aminocarboxymuconate-semialdehyde decarboxylase
MRPDFLVRVFGERQIMIGTDYPFDIFERDPIGVVRATGLPDATLERLTGGNARQFLRLPPPASIPGDL